MSHQPQSASPSSTAGAAGSVLVVKRSFVRAAGVVYDAWLDPANVGRWLFATAGGEMVKVELDPRVGGRFLVVERRGDALAEHFGEYVTLDRPRRIAFTFATDREERPTLVTIDIAPTGEQSCELTLSHAIDPQWAAYEDRAREGWASIFAGLDATIATADRSLRATRVFDAPPALVWKTWTDPRHLTHWWGPVGFETTTFAMDVRPGGVWRFVMHGPDGTDYQNKITYTDVVEHRRLAYKHGGGEDDAAVEPVNFEVNVTFTAIDDGARTRLDMVMLFPTKAARDFTVEKYGADEGLRQTLSRLGEHLPEAEQTDDEFVIERSFAAPRDLVYQAWTDRERLAEWFGPVGMPIGRSSLDLRVGGSYHYQMVAANGSEMWGLWRFTEIVPPQRLAFVQSFSDPDGAQRRAPFSEHWPMEVRTLITFAEHAGQTVLTLRSRPVNPTPQERQAFRDMHKSMNQGWGGTLRQLAGYVGG